MIRKPVQGVYGFLLATVLFCTAGPVFADQSIGFKEYSRKGADAFTAHDDQKALYYFKIAQIFDPADQHLKEFLSVLEHRKVVLKFRISKPSPDSIGYRYYLSEGIRAYRAHNPKALRYFEIALIFYPDSKEARLYVEALNTPPAPMVSSASIPSAGSSHPSVPVNHGKNVAEFSAAVSQQPSAAQETPSAKPSVSMPVMASSGSSTQASAPSPQKTNESAAPQVKALEAGISSHPEAVTPIYLPKNTNKPPVVLSLAQLTANGQKPKLRIDIRSSVILEGSDFQRFLITDEGFIKAKILDPNHLQVDAVRIGSTFLHVWDNEGRHTLYVEVVFPKYVIESAVIPAASYIQHAQPFLVTYANDWSTYYQGRNLSQIKKQSNDFNESLAITGETPYGFLDAYGHYLDFNHYTQFDTYTIGLSQIPLEGTSDFNLRGFDALRYYSPLTMPGTRLRGFFGDVNVLDDTVGISFSHGQQQEPVGFYTASSGTYQFIGSYIDAAKLTLFPKSQTDRYSLNFATAYGSGRSQYLSYLSNHVYSIEGQHKFNDFLTLNGEEANDSSHNSQLASLKWQRGTFISGLNFRNIDKNYTTISSVPVYQGETGAAWTTEGDFNNISETTFIETYQDHLFSNPDHPRALNYDGNAHVRADINSRVWTDTDFNFVDNPGELSPQRNISFNQRISKNYPVWNSLKATVFGGAGYQYSHAPGTSVSNFDRENIIVGGQLPIYKNLSVYTNYEYDWLNQPQGPGRSNPNIINAGILFEKPFNPKFSITSQLVYRDELGVNNTESLLSGQQSIILSGSLNYNPTPALSFFADADASKVMFHVPTEPYDEFEVHVGMRMTFGGSSYWDPLGTVSGIVFKDKNGDGKFRPGDEGIADVKLKVGDKEVKTDKGGRYTVKIRAKGVTVVPELDSIPGGLLFTTPQSLNVNIVQGHTSRADFGLSSQTGIYGIIFVDRSGRGVPEASDTFVGKVRIVLDGKTVERSDPHGAFYFRKVSPGEHTISIDLSSLALEMVPKIKLNNKINVAEGTNYVFNIPVQIKQAVGQQQ